MINLTLRQLRYFEALARHGHFGRAAEACAISPAGPVDADQGTGGATGRRLFERGARQVRLTSFGEEFAVRVARHPALGRRARQISRGPRATGWWAACASASSRRSRLICCRPSSAISTRLMPVSTSTCARRSPPKLIQELARGQARHRHRGPAGVRALVHRGGAVHRGLRAGAARRGRGQAGARSRNAARDAAAAAGRGPLFPRSGAGLLQRAIRADRANCWTASSLSTLVQMVGAGIGVTLIPEMAVAVETRSASVSVARFESPQPSRTIGMIWRKTSPLAQQLIPDIRSRAPVRRRFTRAAEQGCIAAPALRQSWI